MNRILPILCLIAAATHAASAQGPCMPCVGVVVAEPGIASDLVADPLAAADSAGFRVRWPAHLDGTFEPSSAWSISEAGGHPMVDLEFSGAEPSKDENADLARNLEEAVRIVRDLPPGCDYVVAWSETLTGPEAAREYAYLVKRASVVVKGADPRARVFTAALPHDEALARSLFAADIQPYVDGILLTPATLEEIQRTTILLVELDPGKPIAVEHPAGRPEKIPVIAARHAAVGVDLTLFDLRASADAAPFGPPLRLMAREFEGDLTFDPVSGVDGGDSYWSFVRSDDLGLRTVVDSEATPERRIRIPDQTLTNPRLVGPDGAEERLSARRVTGGFEIDLPEVPAAVLRIDRLTAIDLGGFDAAVDVAGSREMPVEEILQRLQVFEGDQARRLRHYEATYTQHLRFRPGSGLEPIEATFVGPFFYRRDLGYDWMWQDLFITGVRWKGSIPELPLLQPAKAAMLPLEIHLDRHYSYRLRGTATVSGRDCWVVDFEPSASDPADGLWAGTVWVDREVFARVKTRAHQIGLTGEVLSNEQVSTFEPLDGEGRPADWTHDSFFLATRVVGQELQSILNASVHVEKESLLSGVRVNRDGIDDRLAEAHASDETMVRDTPRGLRYLEKTADGGREVKEDFDTDRFFAVGGTYYDASFDYPLPVLGVNYFSSDFRGSGSQVNVFFGGVMLNANWADPSFLGSRWDAGAVLSGFAVAGEEKVYRDDLEVATETVESRDARLALQLGRPIGTFVKVDFTAGLEYDWFDRAEDTSPDFVLPQSTSTLYLGTELGYTRGGYRIGGGVFAYDRADWQPWGMPGSQEYDDAQSSYTKWKVSAGKTWWINGFTKLGLTVEHLDGSDLDRFSKYGFGYFADSRVAGYERGRITAEKADAAHISYGFNLAEALRLEVRGDAAWVEDELSGLDDDLIAGVSLNGTLIGPWSTIVNFDIGVPVEGPAEDFTVFVAFLKLFDW